MSTLPAIELGPPTISIIFDVNNSPLAGRDGTHVSFVHFTFFVAPTDILALHLVGSQALDIH